MDEGLNLEQLLEGMTGNLVTPKLSEILAANSKVRPKLISYEIIRGLAKTLKTPVQKEILHNGEVHQIRYVDVEPLCTGSWAMLSLMLLCLSYGEQSTLIDALYPPNLQLCAKAFAVVFTPGIKGETVIMKQDSALLDGIESANAGIAMILTKLKDIGTIPHADEVDKNRRAMRDLVDASRQRDIYHKQYTASVDAAKHQDLSR